MTDAYRPSNGLPYEPVDLPLFGESSRRDRVINLVVGGITGLIVVITLVSAFLLPSGHPVCGLNVFFAVCILFILAPQLVLIYWYRQGDLEPKFRNMIYYNSFAIFVLCVCAMCYINQVACRFGATA